MVWLGMVPSSVRELVLNERRDGITFSFKWSKIVVFTMQIQNKILKSSTRIDTKP